MCGCQYRYPDKDVYFMPYPIVGDIDYSDYDNFLMRKVGVRLLRIHSKLWLTLHSKIDHSPLVPSS